VTEELSSCIAVSHHTRTHCCHAPIWRHDMTQRASTAHQAQWNPLENNNLSDKETIYVYIYIYLLQKVSSWFCCLKFIGLWIFSQQKCKREQLVISTSGLRGVRYPLNISTAQHTVLQYNHPSWFCHKLTNEDQSNLHCLAIEYYNNRGLQKKTTHHLLLLARAVPYYIYIYIRGQL
jgi:hypothetical protein